MVSVAVLVIPRLLSTQGVDANVKYTVAGKKIFRADIVPLTEIETATETAAEIAAETAAEDAIVKPIEKSPEPSQAALAAVENTPPALLDASTSAGQGGKPSVPATSSTGWAVRAGTYAKQTNADSVATALAGNGFTAHKTVVQIALGGNATRIWVGPYAKKETAGEVSLRLQVLIGEKGFVTKHIP